MISAYSIYMNHIACPKAESGFVRQPLATLERFDLRIQQQQPSIAPEGELDEE